jgi:hypothetical protein
MREAMRGIPRNHWNFPVFAMQVRAKNPNNLDHEVHYPRCIL